MDHILERSLQKEGERTHQEVKTSVKFFVARVAVYDKIINEPKLDLKQRWLRTHHNQSNTLGFIPTSAK